MSRAASWRLGGDPDFVRRHVPHLLGKQSCHDTNTNMSATFSTSAVSSLSASLHMQTHRLRKHHFTKTLKQKEPKKQKGNEMRHCILMHAQ